MADMINKITYDELRKHNELMKEALEMAIRWAIDDYDGGAITKKNRAARRYLLKKAINGTWVPRRA